MAEEETGRQGFKRVKFMILGSYRFIRRSAVRLERGRLPPGRPLGRWTES